MIYETNSEISANTAELAETLRRIRIEQGRSPELLPRPKIVDIPLSLVLIDRLEPFRAIAVKYASILAGGQVTRIDTDKLADYAEMGRLLRYSKGFWCGLHAVGVGGALAIMDRMNALIDAEKTEEIHISDEMRKVHFCIEFMTKDVALGHDVFDYRKEHGTDPHGEKQRLLSDPTALRAAIDEALAQLPTKEEDDNYE